MDLKSELAKIRRSLKNLGKSPIPYIAPALIFIIAFSIYPLVYSLYVSFHEYDRVTGTLRFVGIDNYIILLRTPLFFRALINTFSLVAAAVTIEFLLGFSMALLLWGEVKGRAIFRTAFMLPMIITPVVVAIMWKFILWPAWGVGSYVLGFFGIPTIDWFSPQLAIVSILITEVWQWTPFVFLIILSGLVALPVQPFEAARIDGARRWQTFRNITLPYLMPIITVALLFRLMDALKIFDPVYVLTAGGPGTSTYTLAYFIYQEYMAFSHPGLGSAASYIMLIIVVIVVNIYFRYVYKRT